MQGDGTSGASTPDRLLTAVEVATLLSVPESWVQEQTRLGQLPHVALGRYRRYRRAALVEWLLHRETNGNS
ncbi:MAG TPA: helix-turn-helix domain-containing protein [Gaiellaceae bacterium]|jgi:excisionase family DNA binding protein|nr:helix-turn-helix domain-containing protein [Gaiellaceae bacterium]